MDLIKEMETKIPEEFLELRMGFPVLSKRYQMPILCEDAIREKGNINEDCHAFTYRLAHSTQTLWSLGKCCISAN